ncbi:MAG: competence/damage-inducible protein A [Phycisphaerae bacterium]
MATAHILSVGDELTSGQTVNSNASWLALRLSERGIRVLSHVTVGDALVPLVQAIRTAAQSADILLITGGLGPTEDDVTRAGLAGALGEALVEDPVALAQIEVWFASKQRQMHASNRVQALRPISAQSVENPAGTAPGLIARLGACQIYVMPGVPREMKDMFTRVFGPQLAAQVGQQQLKIVKINSFGLGESALGERIRDLMVRGANPSVGTTVHDGIVSVRLYMTGTAEEIAGHETRLRQELDRRLGVLVYGAEEQTLHEALGALLLQHKQTIATAESCTGGLLAKFLTDVPGSSAYFQRGWITYANAAKVALGVPAELMAQYGAVSASVAGALAQRAQTLAGSTWGIGISGIAGPDGGTAVKPVGLMYIGIASPTGTRVWKHIFPGDRAIVRTRAAQMALATVRWQLLGVDPATILGPQYTGAVDGIEN